MEDAAVNKFETVTFVYRNWRDDVEERTVLPKRIYWGTTDYYQTKQWLMEAWDVHRGAERVFALERMLTTMRSGRSRV